VLKICIVNGGGEKDREINGMIGREGIQLQIILEQIFQEKYSAILKKGRTHLPGLLLGG
jgi:hypothetical protein